MNPWAYLGLRALLMASAWLPVRVAHHVIDRAADAVFGQVDRAEFVNTSGESVRL